MIIDLRIIASISAIVVMACIVYNDPVIAAFLVALLCMACLDFPETPDHPCHY